MNNAGILFRTTGIVDKGDGFIAIVGGKCLAGDGYDRVPGKTKREIRKLIEKNERELLTLWNQQTNGVRIDIDATLGKSDGNNYVEKGRQACRHNTRTS